MTEACSCPPEAGNTTCELRSSVLVPSSPVCMKTGKLLDSLTLKATLNVPLTEVRLVENRFL